MPTPHDRHTYAFIDAGYLWAEMKEVLGVIFEEVPSGLDLTYANDHYFRASKIFYYDCIDEEREGHKEYLEALNGERAVQVRTGTLTGKKKRNRRQKEVDVLLAVESLSHAVNGNLHKAAIVAGDLDFRPLIDALVRAGVYVVLFSSAKSTSRPLAWSADDRVSLDVHVLYNWAAPAFKAAHTLPFTHRIGPSSAIHGPLVSLGEAKDGRQMKIIHNQSAKRFEAFRKDDLKDAVVADGFGHRDLGVLKRYLDTVQGPFDWADEGANQPAVGR